MRVLLVNEVEMSSCEKQKCRPAGERGRWGGGAERGAGEATCNDFGADTYGNESGAEPRTTAHAAAKVQALYRSGR